MDRLTTKVFKDEEDYVLKCMCDLTETNGKIEGTVEGCDDYCGSRENCNTCGIRTAINCLGEYEDTGLTPTEIERLKADNARLHKPVDNIECIMKGEQK